MRQPKFALSKALIVIVLAAMTTAAQDYQIRTRVDLVVVPVTVKGSEGQLVSGLNKTDFRVFENGKQQMISNFTIDPVPLSAVVLVDTGLSPRSFEKIQKTLPALTGAFSPFDEMALYRFNTYVAKLTDFTDDKEVFQTALNRLKDIQPSNTADTMAGAPFSSPSPLINGMPVAPSLQLPTATTPPKDVKVLNDAIFAAADELRKRPGERRRIMLVVSDGRTGGNDHTYDQALTRLLENNIEVYGIGMDLAFFARRLSILEKYAKATGGDAFFLNATDSLEHSYTRAAEEARNQYVLGYFSNSEAPGPLPIFREIDVQALQSGLKVLHRRGYYQYPR